MAIPTYQVWVNSAQIPDPDVLKIGLTRERSDIFNRLSVGQCQVELAAQTGRYTIGANKLAINNFVQVFAIDGSSNYTMFTGFVEGFDLNPSLSAQQRMTLKCSDIANRLKNVIQTSLQYSVTQETVFREILNAAGLSSTQYVLGQIPGTVVFAYSDQLSAGEALSQVQGAGAHYIFVDGAGRINVINRNFDNVSATAVASFSAIYDASFRVSDENIINEMSVRITPRRIIFDTQTVGYLTDFVFIAGTGSSNLTIEFTDSQTQERGVPVYELLNVNSGDYIISASPDGTGADLSSQCVLTVNHFAKSANITIVNSGTQNAYLTQLTLRGYPASKANEIKATLPNSASQVSYQKRTQEIQADILQTSAKANGLAAYVLFKYSEPGEELSIQIKNEFPHNISLDINNHVWFQNSLMNVASSFIIKSVEHVIDFDSGLEHTTTLGLETYKIKGWFTLDSSTLGRLNINRLGL